MIAAADLTVQTLSPCLGAFLMPRFIKTYSEKKRKNNFKKNLSTGKRKTGGLLTSKSSAIAAPFLQKPPPIPCTIKLTVSVSKTHSNELRIDTRHKTPS